MADFIDLNPLKGKKQNADALQYKEENDIPDNEVISHEEWNTHIEATQELQKAHKTLDEVSVKGISRNGQLFLPVDGIIPLPSDETTVGVFCEGDLTDIVSADGTMKVKLAFTSVQGGNDTHEIVDVAIRAYRNQEYTTIGTFSATTSGFRNPRYDEYDLSQYGLTSGTYENLLLEATGRTTRVSGSYQFSSVILTTLRLVLNMNYYTPIVASEYDNQFPINYTVYGAVKKVLHVSIKGSTGVANLTYDLAATDDATTKTYRVNDTSAYTLLGHGVHEVTAWLTCDDGKGGTLSSDRLVNTFMVINPLSTGVDFTKPCLMLQNVVDCATNFVQSQLCEYAVFSPKISDKGITNEGPAVDVRFLLTSYSENYGEWKEEYFRIDTKVQPGVANRLLTSVEIEGNAGEEEADSYDSYFRVQRFGEEGDVIDFLYEAKSVDNLYVNVDNKDSYAPYSGSDFLLNPKVRNNTEDNPQRILNARKKSEEVGSTWENFGMIDDGWVTDDEGNKVLRVPSGGRLNIQYYPYSQFASTSDSSMTLDIDFAMRNVTYEAETKNAISIGEVIEATGALLGLWLQPIHGAIYSASNQSESKCDFFWQEDERIHLSININNAIVPNRNDALKPERAESDIDLSATQVALIRVFMNGVIVREMKYSTSNNREFTTSETSHGGINIGCDGCDIDIYSIRCYRQMALSADDVLRNYISTLPTSEQKRKMRAENAMTVGGKIDAELVKSKGKTVLIWHGDEPYKYAADTVKGWWEIKKYNKDLTEDKEHSGTICKATKSLPATRQGSTANTYYYSNIQTKVGDVGDTIRIPITDLHSSIVTGEIKDVVDEETGEVTGQTIELTGGNLGKDFPTRTTFVKYPYEEVGGVGYVVVPDGWIDGNGKYRGRGYSIADVPLAQKLVLKINYASSMQSHLGGVTRMYSDLHTAVVGPNSMQEKTPGSRVAKYNEAVYFFTQGESGSPVYRGGGNFGAGKMDKPTWGYCKSDHPMFAMIEGSDNNFDLTDFRVPFDDYDVWYSPEGEGWIYNDFQQWDFDAGKTKKIKSGTEEVEYPSDDIEARVKECFNFIYLHAPNLAFFSGTFAQFLNSSYATNTVKKYWMTQGEGQYLLKRFRSHSYKEQYVDDEGETQTRIVDDSGWVDAGLPEGEQQLINANGEKLYYLDKDSKTVSTAQTLYPAMVAIYGKIDLREDEMTKQTYEQSDVKTQFAALNQQFINAIVAHAKKYIGWYFKPASLRFHYAFINHLMAGTDNCSKNTYICIDPKAVEVDIDGVKKMCYLMEMHQDDVDTTLATDNNGRTTKPYYVDRMNPYDDKDTAKTTSLYEGMNNQLFNLIELMYEGTKELQSTMKLIFSAMGTFVSSTDDIPGMEGSPNKVSVWGFISKYLFSINRYFSAVAYNEQARIRYEFPAMINYTSRGPGARGVDPITQSMGDALQSELQWMKRRLIYVGSYAWWGPFYDGKIGELGISGASDTFSMQVFHLPHESESNTRYKFTVTPHQYIYPTGILGQTQVDTHKRAAPGKQYELDLGSTTSNDTGLAVNGINFYTSIGNVGDLSTDPRNDVTVNGKRLTEFIAEPTIFYEDMDTHEMVPAFRPKSVVYTARMLEKVSLNGCKQITGVADFSKLTRLQIADIRNTKIYNASFPSSSNMREIYLGEVMTSVTLENMKNLDTFVIQGIASLEEMRSRWMRNNVSVSALGILAESYGI